MATEALTKTYPFLGVSTDDGHEASHPVTSLALDKKVASITEYYSFPSLPWYSVYISALSNTVILSLLLSEVLFFHCFCRKLLFFQSFRRKLLFFHCFCQKMLFFHCICQKMLLFRCFCQKLFFHCFCQKMFFFFPRMISFRPASRSRIRMV